MDKASARRLVEQTFRSSFDRSRFSTFVREILNRYEERTTQFTKGSIPDAFKPHVKSAERLGIYKSPDGEIVDLLVVRLEADTKLARARTALRNFGAYLLNRDGADAALIAFVSPDDKTWRFSYVRLDLVTAATASGKVAIQKELTPARRLSFLVGEGESCHTAQSRFLSLLTTTTAQPSLSDVEAAFNVEAVTEEFFEEYKELFLRTKESLDALCAKDKALKNELVSRDVSTVDLAKKLLGQIVFLYFIQKKGWLGVAKGAPWGSGPTNFLRRLYREEYARFDNFFDEVLEPLFYDSLASDRGDDAWDKRLGCRIPFLNGGLFEPLHGYDWKTTRILLPNTLFSNDEKNSIGDVGTGILDVFDRYNFTVNEAEPLEKEVAIDPEMLGKVFENLLEVRERKSKGSFYTPREIVHFMCQESLINYLDSSLPTVPREDLESFILGGEQAAHYEAARKDGTSSYARTLPGSIEKHARDLDRALSDILVCDPAIGSGAFPVGMMTEIVRARTTLSPYLPLGDRRSPYELKRQAIEHSLYGVDVDGSAAEIAKLRLWLSLVVDEEDLHTINPLPNLDYKIVVGDSLTAVTKTLFNNDLFLELEELKPRFFNETNRRTKTQLKSKIDGLIARITEGKARFDFAIYFSEVFHRRGGFDVVIANPPYVSVEKFARTASQAEWKRRFRTYAARGDIYCFFYEIGLQLLHKKGWLTFISSNKFQRAGYGKELRKMLAAQGIHALIDFCELPVFAAATDPMIVIATPSTSSTPFPALVVKSESEFPQLRASLDERATMYTVSQLRPEGWSLEDSGSLALVEKLRSRGTPLSRFVRGGMYRGIVTGLNEAFVIDEATRDRLIKEDARSAEIIRPWIRGKDITRWQCRSASLYVLLVGYDFHRELRRYPAVLKHLSRFEKQLKARGQCTTSRDGASEGQHHWLELDNNPTVDYLAAFETPSVVYADIGKHLKAFYNTEGLYFGNTAYFLPNTEPYLLAVLLSRTLDYYYRHSMQPLGDPWTSGRMRFFSRTMKDVPIPTMTPADRQLLNKLGRDAIQAAKREKWEDLGRTEREIDSIVARLFGLDAAEQKAIASALASTATFSGGDDAADE